MPIPLKRKIYGAGGRVQVLGPSPAGGDFINVEDKEGVQKEPAFFKGMPLQVFMDKLKCSCGIGVIDLTFGDGNLALASLLADIPYLGFALTDDHAKEGRSC